MSSLDSESPSSQPMQAADDDSEHVAECDWDCGFVGSLQQVDQHELSCPSKVAATAWRQAMVSSRPPRTARLACGRVTASEHTFIVRSAVFCCLKVKPLFFGQTPESF
jgi:hypothetical protein